MNLQDLIIRIGIKALEASQVNGKQISQWTSSDPVLLRVLRFVQVGWPIITESV